jgi:hypothetical protein
VLSAALPTWPARSKCPSRTQAFTHGLDEAVVISAGIALAGAVLALLFLPRTNGGKATAQESNRMEELVVTS